MIPFRISTRNNILTLIIFTAFILGLGSAIIIYSEKSLPFNELLILTLCFFSITLVSVIIYLRGLNREPDSRTMHLLVALSLKFLLELVLALMWFFVAKKTSTASLILFFVLYLGFSLLLVYLMLNTLKHKSL